METSEKVIEIAGEMSRMFEGRERADGTKFRALKDERPQWMQDVIFAGHDNGNRFPNDIDYQFVENAVDAIAEVDKDGGRDQIQERLYEIEPDIYTSDLTAWLNNRNDHVCYLTEVLEEGMEPENGFTLLSMAQKKHIDEVSSAVLDKLFEAAEELAVA